jgi:membrane protease subunit HflC
MKPLYIKFSVAAFALLVLAYQSAFMVLQTQQTLVLQLGEIVRVVRAPGLNFKMPFVQNVIYFDNRLLEYHTRPTEYITKNRKNDVEERVLIDAFVRYRITDPVQFFRAVRNEANLKARLGTIMVANMRKTIANYSLVDLLSDKRRGIMLAIQKEVNAQANNEAVTAEEGVIGAGALGRGFGIKIVDLRLVRADLPPDISQATYERMRQNFTKEAKKFRAEGEEKALEITSTANRERTEIIAEAKKKAETIRGEGDGEAARIYANAFNKDPGFFSFYRSMQAYRKTLNPDETTVILSPNSEFLKHFEAR